MTPVECFFSFVMPKLSPEHTRLLEVFNHYYSLYNQSTIVFASDLTIEDVTYEDSYLFVFGVLGRKSLPHPAEWIWNQSKSKHTIQIRDNLKINVTKWNPRKSKVSKGNIRPGYKLWICEIISHDTKGSHVNFLWVEKGKENTSISSDINCYSYDLSFDEENYSNFFGDEETLLHDLFFLFMNLLNHYP